MQRNLGDNNEYYTVIYSGQEYGIVGIYQEGLIKNPKYKKTIITFGSLGEVNIVGTYVFMSFSFMIILVTLIFLKRKNKRRETEPATSSN